MPVLVPRRGLMVVGAAVVGATALGCTGAPGTYDLKDSVRDLLRPFGVALPIIDNILRTMECGNGKTSAFRRTFAASHVKPVKLFRNFRTAQKNRRHRSEGDER